MAAQQPAQQNAAQQPPQQQLYPPPPPFYRLYRPGAELLPPLPPPPPTAEYQHFGLIEHANVVIPALTGKQLFQTRPDGSIDFKGQLLALHRELVAQVLELLGVLTEKPSMWARQVENMSAVLRNMQQLSNLVRPEQARQTLLHTLAGEVEQRRQAAQQLREKVALADAALAGGAQELAAAVAALRQAAEATSAAAPERMNGDAS